MKQKRVAAIHDISGFGKCSLTVALPVISACGIETSVIPTAVLSTHTGGFKNFTFRDLTDDIMPIVNHWKDNNIEFDALYSGYLGSIEQVEILKKVFDELKGKDTFICIDPVMADHGVLYGGFKPEFPKSMASLCAKADLITPNITEAVFMLGEDYIEGPYTKEYIDGLLHRLAKITSGSVVLTGVFFDNEKLGAACYNAKTGEISYSFEKIIDKMYHGTGDLFTSALLSAYLCGKTLEQATAIAVEFTALCIKDTKENFPDMWYGVNFERNLSKLIEKVN